jgi:hypothetical protein
MRQLTLVLLVAASAANAKASAQTTTCPSPGPVARSYSLPTIGEDNVRRAEAILRDWSGDFRPGSQDQFDAEEHHVLSMLRRLQDTLAGSLAPTLLYIIARPYSASSFRVTPLQSAAAHFYVGAGLPDSSLEGILLSHDVELANRMTVYWALRWRDLPVRRLSNARMDFLCQLARQIVSAPRENAMPHDQQVSVLFASLDHERLLTSLPAAALLEDADIRSAMIRLRAQDSVPSPRDPRH